MGGAGAAVDIGMSLKRSRTLGRLTRRGEFVAVASTGRRAVLPTLVVQARRHDRRLHPGEDGPPLRAGFTASRKVGGAVERNRAKRRLRALAAEVLPAHARPGHDVVLVARGTTVTCAYADLRADLLRGLRRVGLYREAPPAGAAADEAEAMS